MRYEIRDMRYEIYANSRLSGCRDTRPRVSVYQFPFIGEIVSAVIARVSQKPVAIP